MAEEPRGPKPRRRLFIANPDPDDVPGERDYAYQQDATNYYNSYSPTPNVHTSRPSPSTLSRFIPPLSTADLSTVVAPGNPSHPGLSPSNTSSPAAEESTPPPSTPGLPPQPIDPVNLELPQQDPQPVVNMERPSGDSLSSRASKFFRNLGSAPQQHAKGPRPADTHGRRSRPSPTVSTSAPDLGTPTTINTPASSHSGLSIGSDKSDMNKLLIVVTADSERYVTVDITGAKNAAFIREYIFSKMKICQDEEQSQFSIYKTEIGAFAIGEALTDDQLFSLCRDRGDNKGSLKFFISHKNAVVHEEPHRPYTPVINSIPPPVLPAFPASQASPVRIKPPRCRSRHGSVSSTSEPHTAEATGYEADLDNGDREKDVHRVPVRHQQQSPHLNQVSPPALRKISSPPLRPTSPLKVASSPPINSERPRTHEEVDPPQLKPTPPNVPPLSPLRPNFPILEDGGTLIPPPPSLSTHTRAGSDGTEQVHKTSEQYQMKPRIPPPPPPPPVPSYKARSGSPRDETATAATAVSASTSAARESRGRVEEPDDWTFISHQDTEPGMFSQEPRVSPTTPRHPRQHGSPVRYGLPPYPRSKPRTSAVPPTSRAAVPVNYLVTWKPEEGGGRKNGLTSPSTSSGSRLSKGAKSMDNLRAGLSYSSLHRQANYGRNPLPVSQVRENNYYNGVVAPSLPRSYEPSRQVRPLPAQGTNLTNPDSSTYNHRSPYPPFNSTLSPSASELLTRPQSAHSDSVSPPPSQSRSQADTTSPNTLPQISTTVSSRKPYNDRQADSRSTPPRSPASPLSPPFLSHSESSSSALPSKLGILNEDELSAPTLKQEERVKIAELLNSNNSESTLIASRLSEADRVNPPSPVSSTTTTTMTSLTSTYGGADDDDSDSEPGTMIWKKRPENPMSPSQRPPLTVQIVGGKTEETATASTQLSQRPSISRAEKKEDKKSRGHMFTETGDVNWAPRPLPEDVYDRLEEFFPEHDLDKPVIEASSGSTSPTAPDAASSLPQPPQAPEAPEAPEKKGMIRARKSIRYVAEDFKKRIDKKANNDAASYSNLMRKRNTKFWGRRTEEVTTAQPRSNSIGSNGSASSAPTFKWVRGELIGKGTYGRVYLAMNANTGEMMAVKQVELPQTPSDRNDSRQASMVQALKLESETLKDLDHPNIVQYLGFEETPTNLSIFLEYVPGGSIGSCLTKHGRFDENVTKSFTHQILDGLHYLHSKGILHRDLKADNILVEMSGVCKISDFGISKRTDDIGGGAFTAMQGTVFWMAPEVINTQKKGYNFKVDIWSVGCVVLEMWAGKRPWTGEEMVAVMFKLYQSKLPPPVPDDVVLSDLADDFRMRCFAINPEERATAPELMAHPYLELPTDWHFSKFT